MQNGKDDYSGKRRKDKNTKVIVLAVLTAILLCGLYYDTFLGKAYIKTYMNQKMQILEKQNQKSKHINASKLVINLNNQGKVIFKTNGKNFIQCTKDGVKYFESFGNQKWSDTFTMTNPIMVSDGDVFAIGEQMGRTVKVYNSAGFLYQVQTDQVISQMSINKNGYLALILNNKTDYNVEVYNSSGSAVMTRKDMDEGVYPIALAISGDNRVMAVSYIDTRDIGIISRVLFFYLNEKEGKEWEDSMFASIEKPDEIIPVLSYMDSNVLAAVSDKSVFAADLEGKELWSIPLTNQLSKVSLDGKSSIVLAYGEVIGGKDGKEEGLVEWIGLDGRVLGSIQMDDEVTYLKGKKDVVVIGSNRDFSAVSSNGKVIWHQKATQDMDDILIMENNNTVLYVTKTSAEILDMSKLNNKEDQTEEENKADEEKNPDEQTQQIVPDQANDPSSNETIDQTQEATPENGETTP